MLTDAKEKATILVFPRKNILNGLWTVSLNNYITFYF